MQSTSEDSDEYQGEIDDLFDDIDSNAVVDSSLNINNPGNNNHQNLVQNIDNPEQEQKKQSGRDCSQQEIEDFLKHKKNCPKSFTSIDNDNHLINISRTVTSVSSQLKNIARIVMAAMIISIIMIIIIIMTDMDQNLK